MSKHILFNHHEGGFFSNFNKVITCLAHEEDVTKITWCLQGQPFGAFAYNCDEVFSKLFETYDEKKPIESYYGKAQFEHLEYTGQNAHNLYTGDDEWRTTLHNTYKKYIIPTKLLQDNIDVVDKSFDKNTNIKIGILKRNQLLKCEQVSNTMPVIDRYIDAIHQIYGNKTCVLSVDNTTDIEQFKSNSDLKFVYSTGIRRTNKDTDMEPHFTPGTIQDALYYFMDVYMLSRCDYLIHPISNMATAALYMNPNLKSIYLQ